MNNFSIFFWDSNDVPKVFNMKKNAIVTVGRDIDNDLVISMNSVSRKHGIFINTESKIHYVDYSSTFGSFINGKKINNEEAVTINTGDKLNLGNAELTVSVSSDSRI